jgi:hypothetical protein
VRVCHLTDRCKLRVGTKIPQQPLHAVLPHPLKADRVLRGGPGGALHSPQFLVKLLAAGRGVGVDGGDEDRRQERRADAGLVSDRDAVDNAWARGGVGG